MVIVMWKLGLATILVVTATAHAQPVQLAELPSNVTEGRIVVDASPAEIYELVTSYDQWPKILTDIRSVTVESGGRENARVQFRSRAIGRPVTVQFTNEPGRLISFKGVKGPPGGRASGRYTLIPIDGGKQTQVVAELYMDIVGAPGLFVRSSTVRDIRRTKVQSDLTDIAAHFAARRP